MRVEWNVGIGDRAAPTTTTTNSSSTPSATEYVVSSKDCALLLPDVRREGNGEVNIPLGETGLMQSQSSHSNGNYFACPSSTSTAVSVLSSQSNGTSTHSASATTSSTLALAIGLSESSREERPQQQQQPPHQVTISSQPTAIPGLVSSDLSSSVEQSAHESNNSYNGIFLVDGLGHGVRIDHSQQRIGGCSMANCNSSAADLNPCLNFSGLPTLITSPAANDIGMAMNIDTNHVNTSTSPSTSALNTPYYPLNPVCIQINANHPSPSIINSFMTDTGNSAGSGRVPVRYDASSVNISPLGHNVIQNSPSVTPVRVTCNSDPSPQSPVNSVPKSNSSNIADFSSPSTNNVSLLLPLTSSTPQVRSDNGSGPVMISTPHSIPNAILPERKLISTEAQTEDLPVLVPPPLPQRNREQRKRERRERRREANSQQSSSNNHDLSSSRPNSNTTQQSQRHTSSNAREASSPGAPNPNAADDHPEFRRIPVSPVNIPNLDPSNILSYGRSNLDTIGLPDLLNSHLPPPYSTLPQHCERRPQMGTVPLAMISPHPIPLLPPPPLLVPPSCLQPPPQPVRYHFSPTHTSASRRSMRATRGMPYASEEEPKSCCGMSTSQAVSIRWFIIVIAVIGICCTVAGTALGAARSAGKEHLTLSLLMIGVGVVLLTVSAVAWRLTANETGTSCRAMLGFARNGSSRGDGGAEPNRRFVPRLAPSYGRPHHPYAAMMYPDFQYRPPPPSYQASMQEYRLRLLLLERSNPTIAAAASLASPAALTMFPPPPAYRPYHGPMRPAPTNNRNDADYSRPPSYRSRSSGNSGVAEGTNAVHSAIDPGNGQFHIVMDSPHHSRDPSLISYLSQQSILENGSISGGGGNGQQGGNHNVTTTVVTVMQTVSVGMGLELDMSALSYDPNASSSGQCDENKEYPNQSQVGDPEKKALALGSKGNVNSSDGNLVRIVQTTDSSQVIGRDSVIVTVSGSNHSLWSQSLHHPPNNDYSSSNMPDTQRNNLPENGEVQILAHL